MQRECSLRYSKTRYRGQGKNEISLYVVTTCSNIQTMRTKEVITKEKMSSSLDKIHCKMAAIMKGPRLVLLTNVSLPDERSTSQ